MLVSRLPLGCGLTKSFGNNPINPNRSACAHHSRDPQPLFLCRDVALALIVFVLLKELVKVGIVLFLLVQRKGKVPLKLRRSSYLEP